MLKGHFKLKLMYQTWTTQSTTIFVVTEPNQQEVESSCGKNCIIRTSLFPTHSSGWPPMFNIIFPQVIYGYCQLSCLPPKPFHTMQTSVAQGWIADDCFHSAHAPLCHEITDNFQPPMNRHLLVRQSHCRLSAALIVDLIMLPLFFFITISSNSSSSYSHSS